MKNLLKVLLAISLSLSVGSLSFSENFEIPRDNDQNIPMDMDLMGVDVFTATASANAIGSTTPVILYGYSVSSDALTNNALLRDTNTLNITSNIKLTLFPDAYCTTGNQTCTTKMPQPVFFRNGLSINLGAATGSSLAAGQSHSRWMFYVRYLREGAVPFKTPSQVDPRITVDNVGVQ